MCSLFHAMHCHQSERERVPTSESPKLSMRRLDVARLLLHCFVSAVEHALEKEAEVCLQ